MIFKSQKPFYRILLVSPTFFLSLGCLWFLKGAFIKQDYFGVIIAGLLFLFCSIILVAFALIHKKLKVEQDFILLKTAIGFQKEIFFKDIDRLEISSPKWFSFISNM